MQSNTTIPVTWVGIAVGLFLGYIAVRFGIARLIVVGVFGLVGFAYTSIRQGDIDLVEQLSRFQGRTRAL